MNIPVIGVLFRSRDYQREETELMITATPYIARPMEPSQVQRPMTASSRPMTRRRFSSGA